MEITFRAFIDVPELATATCVLVVNLEQDYMNKIHPPCQRFFWHCCSVNYRYVTCGGLLQETLRHFKTMPEKYGYCEVQARCTFVRLAGQICTLAGQVFYRTIGWAIIQRLMIVYKTINASIGYWLFNTNARSLKVRIATRCAKYTAKTCPSTIKLTDRNHRTRAFMIAILSE